MTEETAKQLADAMNRLAAAIERATSGGLGGLHVHHHAIPYLPQPVYQPHPFYGPTVSPIWSGLAANGMGDGDSVI